MKRAVHRAFVVEAPCEGFDGIVEWGFQAVCEETLTACDAHGFDAANGGTGTDGDAMESAVEYLGQADLHLADSPHFCNARHVLEMGHPQ